MESRIEQAEAIFCDAHVLTDAVQRREFLERTCAGDDRLRAEVEDMLAAQVDGEIFFAESRLAVEAPFDSPNELARTVAGELTRREEIVPESPLDERPGTWIGPYKILQKIGEGGCGVVYMAEQEKPVRRRVALKVIKLGMDTKNVIARFEAEQNALALMDHSNIARVLDAGATEHGRPYFVMELVHGVRITDYCDENKLTTPQRLELFILVCLAIQHAHQKGVVHRDIKPSNILVTVVDGRPVPKVIDFGIAKAMEGKLTSKTNFTLFGHFIGTPAYMSPEQAQLTGMDVDTRSDIYSLGVLLYELLTGKTPFDQQELIASGINEMRRTLSDREPDRPSARLDSLTPAELTMTAQRRHVEPLKLRLALSGDLDWIVMRSLEKDRARRYQTANALALDVQRYLDNEPILARPPSRLYRFQKLFRRNRILFVASGIVALSLVAGLWVSTWLWLKEREALQRMMEAEQQKAALQREASHLESLRQTAEAGLTFAEAAALIQQTKLDQADALLDKIPQFTPGIDQVAMFRTVGDWDADKGHWIRAKNRLATLTKFNYGTETKISASDCTLDDLRNAALLVDQGEFSEYEHFRKTVIARFASTEDPVIAERVLRTCLLTKADHETIQTLTHLSNLVASSFEHSRQKFGEAMAAWHAYSLALMAYRSGDYVSATNWCGRALKSDRGTLCLDGGVRIIHAMACSQLGRLDEASEELAGSRDPIEDEAIRSAVPHNKWQGFWFDWAVARILLREATALVEEKQSATK